MTEQIISRTYMREKGRAAFKAGQSRESHEMNWHALALVEWRAGWDEALYESRRKQAA